jgi:filamentous hemagglutinin
VGTTLFAASEGLLGGAARGVSVAGPFPLSAINATRGTTNCVNCAVALDATLGGSQASALGGSAVPLAQVPGIFGATGFTRFSSATGIQSQLGTAGHGARGVVVGLRGPGGAAHAFNAVNQGGVVSFLDAQVGGAASLQGYQSFLFIRTF